jgi:hypothetical protein
MGIWWCDKQFNDEGGENLETKSKLDTKSTRKTKSVRISCGCPHAWHVFLVNKTEAEDSRRILDRLHGRKSALKNKVFYKVFNI